MANKSKAKNKNPFGIAGGKHTNKRKWKRRKFYEVQLMRTNGKNLKKCGIKIMRQKLLQRYNIAHKRRKDISRQLFDDREFQDIYNIQKVVVDSEEGGLKFRLKHVKSTENDGYRLISLNLLQNFLTTLTSHTINCTGLKLLTKVVPNVPPVKMLREVRNNGLASIILSECQGCKQTFRFETSPQLPIKNSRHYDINVRSVWGSMVTGSGVSGLNELMGTLNSPGMSDPTFSLIEQEIGDLWAESLEEDLLEAGAEERRIAIEKGNYDDGVPCTTVIADGGWSKRSHKHTYNALGGVGVIIGAETGKLLHIGVRNKHCYICSKAETSHTTPAPHRCFKNWSQSSQSMEADIIVEGFLKAEKMHGLRYMKLIGDGDSSVYPKIQENVPVWGRKVEKLECANHVCKCLRTNLEKLVEENSYYKGKGRLSKTARVKIVSAVRCAIRLRSQELDKKNAIKKLDHDIRNSVHHVFGNHQKCSDFCKAKARGGKGSNIRPSNNISSKDDEEETIPNIIQGLSEIWSETTSIDKEEESRGDCEVECTLDGMMIRDISVLLDRVAVKSSRLLGNSTTNLAESWMAIRAKFDGGKLYNRCNRGSWHSRCYGGALRKNLGPTWSTKVWERTTSTKAGKHFQHLYETRHSALARTTTAQRKPERKARRWKRKMETGRQSESKKAKADYGEHSLEAVEDITSERLEEVKDTYLKTHINLSDEKIKFIEMVTRQQSANAVWKEERKKRITSSNFGMIVRRNPKIKVEKLVKRLVYPTFRGNDYTRKGIHDEAITIQEYMSRKEEENSPVSVQHVGLIICRGNEFLATSPDGKVTELNGDTGLIEIKNLLQNKPINLYQAARTIGKTFCLELLKKKLCLKRTHDYFFQVQGQLNITGLPWVDFVVRTEKPYQMHIERIYRDQCLWSQQMLPKLKAFYFSAILPELAVPTHNTLSGIREPGIWYTDIPNNKGGLVKKDIKQKTRTNSKKDTEIYSPTYIQDNPPLDNTQLPASTTSFSASTTDVSTTTSATNLLSISTHRSRRLPKVKFLGRRISHEWIEDETKGITKWYSGTVTNTISGKDGDPDTIYEVLYDGEDQSYSIDHLFQDYQSSSVKFIDLYIFNCEEIAIQHDCSYRIEKFKPRDNILWLGQCCRAFVRKKITLRVEFFYPI